MASAVLAATLGACAAGTRAPDPARGGALFAQYCALCHGASARGDGPLAADMPAPPADLTRLAAGNGGVFPAGRVIATVHGYAGRNHAMPAFGPLLAGPGVRWTAPGGETVTAPAPLIDIAAWLAGVQEG